MKRDFAEARALLDAIANSPSMCRTLQKSSNSELITYCRAKLCNHPIIHLLIERLENLKDMNEDIYQQ